MATVLAIMAKQRGDVEFVHQSLFYPMTDANAESSESLRKFKDGPYGSAAGLEWFWSSYLADQALRSEITVSPLQATLADLEGLPPALVIVDENDVLRDQGEAYADKLRNAGVPTTSVRFNGTIHDFMRLNALRDSESTRAAISVAVAAIRRRSGPTDRYTSAEWSRDRSLLEMAPCFRTLTTGRGHNSAFHCSAVDGRWQSLTNSDNDTGG